VSKLKKFITGIVAGAVLATAGVGVAAANWTRTYAGVICQAKASNVVCVRTDGSGWGIGINKDFVMMRNSSTGARIIRFH